MRPILVLSLFTPFVLAFDLQGRIAWNAICPGFKELGHTKVVLDEGYYFGSVRRDGSFVIPGVDVGSYIFAVQSHDHIFDTLRVDVPPQPQSTDAQVLPDVYPYVPGTPHDPPSNVSLPYPLTLVPRQKNQYFVERQSFNLTGMLGNPMMLMMVVTGVLVIAMPYIMKNLDPEVAKEVAERQNRLAHIQNTVTSGDIRGGFNAILASANDESRTPPESPQKTPASTPSRRGGGSAKGRRR